MLRKLSLVAGLFLSSVSYADSNKVSIFPPNNIKHPIGEESTGGITEKQFNDIIDTALEIYQPIAKANGEVLVYNRLINDSTVNSDACRGCENGKAIINAYGGLSRDSHISVESYALVASHELSHLYGFTYGTTTRPNVFINKTYKMSAESIADIFGNQFVEALLLKGLMAKGYTFSLSTDNYIDTKCADKWNRDTLDYKLCIIRLNAGNELGSLLAELNGDPTPTYDQRDTTVVKKTNLSYPSTLCRLNNYWDAVFNLPYSKCWFFK